MVRGIIRPSARWREIASAIAFFNFCGDSVGVMLLIRPCGKASKLLQSVIGLVFYCECGANQTTKKAAADMVISVARVTNSRPAHVPSGGGTPVPQSRPWYVGDSSLMQSRKGAVASLSLMVNMAGLMYYFFGLERRAKNVFGFGSFGLMVPYSENRSDRTRS